MAVRAVPTTLARASGAAMRSRAGRVGEAVAECGKGVRPGGSSPVSHAGRGRALVKARRDADAMAALNEAVRLGPLPAEAHAWRCRAPVASGRSTDAVESPDEALRLRPRRRGAMCGGAARRSPRARPTGRSAPVRQPCRSGTAAAGRRARPRRIPDRPRGRGACCCAAALCHSPAAWRPARTRMRTKRPRGRPLGPQYGCAGRQACRLVLHRGQDWAPSRGPRRKASAWRSRRGPTRRQPARVRARPCSPPV